MNVFANPNFEFRITPQGRFFIRRIDDQKFLGIFETLGEVEATVKRSDETADSRARFVEMLASFPPIHRREKPCHQQRRQQAEREARQRERVYQTAWELSEPVGRSRVRSGSSH